jgi:hypothetical protein
MDRPKKPPRSTRADELQRELKKSTDFKRQHVDEEIIQRKAKVLDVLYHGTEEQFREALRAGGWNEDSPEGREFLSAFRRLRGLV